MALIIALMSMTLLSALGSALVLTTVVETAIASNYRDAAVLSYAAEAAAGRVMLDLDSAPDWTAIAADPYLDGALAQLVPGASPGIQVHVSLAVAVEEGGATEPARAVATVRATSELGAARRTLEVVVTRALAAEAPAAPQSLLSWQERP